MNQLTNSSQGSAGTTKATILLVDDEPHYLSTASYLLKRHFEVYTATDGKQACELAAKHAFAVMLVDYRMVGQLGTDLLVELRKLQPSAIRFLITSYNDQHVYQAAINQAHVYGFVSKPVHFENLVLDIQRALEHQQADMLASRSERLAMSGLLASMAVHDMRNSLQGLGFVIPLLTDPGQPADLQEAGKTLLWTKKTLLSCIQEILAVSKGEPPSYTKTRQHLGPIVEQTVELLERMAPKHRLVVRIPPDLPQLFLSEVHLHRLLTNVINNAIQATPNGCTIEIDALERGGLITLTIADDGPGLPQEVKDHLFQPFVSTKGSQGVGLGLRLCLEVAKGHGGAFFLRPSVPGHSKGTAFVLQLPLEQKVSA